MKIPPLLTALLILTANARDFRPVTRLENLPAGNASVQPCYIFPTTPGIHYTVESSNNLTDWTVEEEHYGLGHEYVVTLREFTPPPPPPSGTPPPVLPPRAINVSIRMQPASGLAGGLVVSWASLDHGGQVVVGIAGEMVPAWNQIPFFCDRYGAYNFFIWHPNLPLAPPAENPSLGPLDSAQLAELEASLPAMNQQITDSIARARNAPAPPPAAPGARRFLRVKVDSGTDTDLDGSPDWAEFEIAARGTGMMIAGVTGDAFNPDSNEDNIPDGLQLDVDLDGTSDRRDVDSTDRTTFLPLGDYPRYAMFEILGKAIQINDRGTVIFPEKVWKGGILSDLPGGTTGEPLASARGINDLDVILGTAARDPNYPDNPESIPGKICYWPDPAAPYQTVSVTEEGQAVVAYVHHDGIRFKGPAPILSSSGHFIAHGYAENPAPGYTDKYDSYPTIWQIPLSGAQANRTTATAGARYLSGTSLMWGSSTPYDQDRPGQVHESSALPTLSFYPHNVISLSTPFETQTIFATSAGAESTQVFEAGQWRNNETYAYSIDIAADGTAIGRNQQGITAPILLNGKWHDIRRSAPGLPEVWADEYVKLTDTTSRGWVLALDEPEAKSAALLPIRAEGSYTCPAANPDGSHTIDTEAAGVDQFSLGSFDPGPAVLDRIWIMTPEGGSSGTATLKAPVATSTPLKLSATGVTFGGQAELELTQNSGLFQIRATTTGSSGKDLPLELKLAGSTSISKPIGLKIMKNRVVKVNIFQVCRRQTPGGPYAFPGLLPTTAQITAHLNDMFKPQINVTFDILPEIQIIAIPWDLNGDQILNTPGAGLYSPEQIAILDALPTNVRADNITLLIIASKKNDGNVIGLDQNPNGTGAALGVTNRTGTEGHPGPTCWILGERLQKQLGTHAQMDTMAHEIGHVFVGYGHPDSKSEPGEVPLLGTETHAHRRLMCSGRNSSERSRLLVKGEWDEAELWLAEEERSGRMNQ